MEFSLIMWRRPVTSSALGLGLRLRHSRQEPDSEMEAGQRAERCGEIM